MSHQPYGRHTYGYENIRAFSWGEGTKLRVGKFCSIAENIKVYLGGNHRTDWVTTYPFGHRERERFNNFDGKGHPKSNGDVVIENDVWIGSNVTIMSGVHIGSGAVIANNSHVVKDVKPYTIVGGNPARYIKSRFTDSQIEKLLEISWWDWDDEKINEHLDLMCSENIDLFIDRFTK